MSPVSNRKMGIVGYRHRPASYNMAADLGPVPDLHISPDTRTAMHARLVRYKGASVQHGFSEQDGIPCHLSRLHGDGLMGHPCPSFMG